MKGSVEWKYLALIVSEEEISDAMYSSSYEYKERFAQSGAGSILIAMSIAYFFAIFAILKQHFSIK